MSRFLARTKVSMFSKSRRNVGGLFVILACLIGLGALINGQAQSAFSPLGSNGQDHQSQVRHQYVMESSWNGCGGIPYEGWEGCTSQSGTVLKRDDGEKVYFVHEHCTSSKAAKDEELLRLTGAKEAASKWQISQKTPMDDALLVELSNPVQVGLADPATSRWVCLWIEDSALVLIYGSDREHVIEYFRIHKQNKEH